LGESKVTVWRPESKDRDAQKSQELEQARRMLDRRYNELKSGKVKGIDGEEVFAKLRRKSESRRSSDQ
jgi:hypothetical protein